MSDYEEWTPHTADEGGCLNGRKVVLVRKKPEKKCFNADNYPLFYVREHCLCTEDDFHCDFGYSKNEAGICVLDNEINLYNFLSDPPHCNNYFLRSDGY